MTHLLRAELTRFLNRKISWIVFGVVLLAIAGMTLLFALQTAPPSQAQIDQATTYYEQEHADWESSHEASEKECLASDGATAEMCAWPEPTIDSYLFQLSFADAGPSLVLVGVAFLGLATAVVTSSLVGADFSSGTMSNWLSYVPRRGRVFASRLIIAVVVPLLVSAVILAADLAVFSLVVRAQGATGGLTGSDTVWATYGRGLLVIVFGAVLGTTVAFLTRRTIAAVGIILGYLIVKLIAAGVFGFTPWFGHITPWFPENNALAVLMGDYPYQINTETITANGASYTSEEKVLPWEQGLIYLGVAAAGLVTAALLTFRRRDQG